MDLRMKHAGFKLGIALMYVSVSLLFLSCQSSENESENLLQYVDPFVGTTYTGHTFWSYLSLGIYATWSSNR